MEKRKVPCITAIVLENGVITDWAIGEATPSASVKTIAMMERKLSRLQKSNSPLAQQKKDKSHWTKKPMRWQKLMSKNKCFKQGK